MGAVAAGLAIGGTALTLYGQYQNAKAQAKQAKFTAEQLEQNRLLGIERAKDAYWRGEQDETEFRQNIEQLKSNQKVSFAASGFDVTEGTAMDVLLNTADLGERDAMKIRTNAHNEAYAYLMGAEQAGMQAQAAIQAQKDIGRALPYSMGATLLTGGAQAYQAYNV